MKETRWTSINGRWGLSIVAPPDIKWNTPQYGEMVSLGKLEGHQTYQFIPMWSNELTGNWYYVCEDSENIVGAVEICSIGLQSNNFVFLWALSPFSVLRIFGYARRSSRIVAFKNGQLVSLPSGVMAAMGLIPTEKEIVKPKLPPIDNTLNKILKKTKLL